ncbi:helix-turn-helix domain-containing protein [Amycolatopsis sp. NPDC004378]
MDETYLTVEEAAGYLNTSTRFVRRLISERRIPFYKAGSHVRIGKEDLKDFMAAGRVEPVTRESVLRDLTKLE